MEEEVLRLCAFEDLEEQALVGMFEERNWRVKRLECSATHCNLNGVCQIASVLTHAHCRVEMLKVKGAFSSHSQCVRLFQALQASSLTSLTITQAFLSPHALRALATSLLHTCITHLNLSSNSISTLAIVDMTNIALQQSTSLFAKQLEYLNLEQNLICSLGMDALGRALLNCSALRVLLLANNSDKHATQTLLRHLRNRPPTHSLLHELSMDVCDAHLLECFQEQDAVVLCLSQLTFLRLEVVCNKQQAAIATKQQDYSSCMHVLARVPRLALAQLSHQQFLALCRALHSAASRVRHLELRAVKRDLRLLPLARLEQLTLLSCTFSMPFITHVRAVLLSGNCELRRLSIDDLSHREALQLIACLQSPKCNLIDLQLYLQSATNEWDEEEVRDLLQSELHLCRTKRMLCGMLGAAIHPRLALRSALRRMPMELMRLVGAHLL